MHDQIINQHDLDTVNIASYSKIFDKVTCTHLSISQTTFEKPKVAILFHHTKPVVVAFP